MTARTAKLLAALLLVLAPGLAIVPAASGREPRGAAGADDALRELVARSRTGVLADRVLPLARLGELDGGPASPAVDRARWRQAYDELRRASAGGPARPALAALDAGARASVRAGVLPIALFDVAYERLAPGALRDGASLATAGGPPLVAARAVAGAVLARPAHRGGDLVFSLEPERLVTDGPPPRAITLDFGDGRGPRAVALGERVRVRYAAAGPQVIEARVTRADGSVATARCAFAVAALAAPLPDDTLFVTAGIPHLGVHGTGEAYVALAPGRSSIVNPVVVVEGFDLDNSMDWDELYALLGQHDLLESLRAAGFDAVVLNFTDATAAIQQNAYVVAELLQQVQARIDPQASIALVGASMGGLCSRYALAYMETHALPHRVRTWISFDAPQAGANIPLGLQYWIQFFGLLSTFRGALRLS